ncbi:MAG: DNRLRE domain-containing protein [Acidobacteria bacterium]|nr:DNRLRE domain-containing protein [Acidobacteriota bacterium]
MKRLIAGWAIAMASAAWGLDLPVVADVTVGSVQGGALPNLTVGGGSRVLLRFGVGVMPLTVTPSQVMKATLMIHVNRMGAGGPVQVAQLLGPFEEMTVMAADAPGVGSVLSTMNPAVGWNVVDVTSLVQQWVAAPGAAFGVELTVPSGSAAQVLVDSKENTQTSHPAVVRVVLNGPTGAAGLAGLTGPPGPTGAMNGSFEIVAAAMCDLYKQKGLAVPAGISCPSKVAFVTVGMFNGNLGGVAGADAQCQNEAARAGLSGMFKAWLSTAASPAAARLTHSEVPYLKRDGVQVAFNWTDLTDGTIYKGIQVTAAGTGVSLTSGVWTGTLTNGNAEAKNCVNWTDASAGQAGLNGIVSGLGGTWTDNGAASCSTFRRLYCLEQ